jgi:hypothetical protein
MPTYTVVQRDPNSFTRTSQGTYAQIKYECNHKHRTIAGALKCLQSIANDTRSINAHIEITTKYQQYDGKRVSDEDIESTREDLNRQGIYA